MLRYIPGHSNPLADYYIGTSMSLTLDLIGLIRKRPVSTTDLDDAALFTLDAVATAYAGSSTPVGAILRGWATDGDLDLKRKALLMGALTHITETRRYSPSAKKPAPAVNKCCAQYCTVSKPCVVSALPWDRRIIVSGTTPRPVDPSARRWRRPACSN
jgi:hypothetical protein